MILKSTDFPVPVRFAVTLLCADFESISSIITGSGDRCPRQEFEGSALIINHRRQAIPLPI